MLPRMGWDCYSDTQGHGVQFGNERGKPLTAGSIYTSLPGTWKSFAKRSDAQYLKASDGVINLNINTSYHDTTTGQKVGISWREIIGGQWDDDLAGWAQTITDFGSDRLIFGVGMHEPNIKSANQPKTSDYDLADFPALVEKIHAFFRGAGVKNRLYVTPTVSVFHSSSRTRPPLWKVFEPDPAHYDLLGCDHYTHDYNWSSPASKGEPFIATAQALGKRFYVGECGNTMKDSRRPQWYRDVCTLYGPASGTRENSAVCVNFNMDGNEVGEYGLQPGSPEWAALLAATKDWT